MKTTQARLVFGALAGAVLSTSGCATVFNGTTHEVSVTSAPSGAEVIVRRGSRAGEGEQVFAGRTPAMMMLPRKHEYVVTISQPGYKTVRIAVLQPGIQPWWWANVWPGNLFGFVDYFNGAIYRLAPGTIAVTLEVASSPESAANQL